MKRRRGLYNHASTKASIIFDRYLTVEALEDGLTVTHSKGTIYYCINGSGNWIKLSSNTASPTLKAGQRISFKATGINPSSNDQQIAGNYGIGTMTISKRCAIRGSMHSMVYGDNEENTLNTGANYQFYRFFYGNTNIIYAHNLNLSSKYVGYYGYRGMFEGCSNLMTAPKLPATSFNSGAYDSMFKNCTSLTTAPRLDSTSLGNGVYSGMFQGCTSLTTAPELPATTLRENCYTSMFQGCTSLTTAPELPATVLQQSCYNSMFSGCKSLEKAPYLPAKTLASSCYSYMFTNCVKLNYIIADFTTTPSTSYTGYWVTGVASSGTFVKNPNATWDVRGTHGIPNNWTVQTAA